MRILGAILVAGLLLVACNKDEDCDNLESNIIGVWELSFDDSVVEFKSDGTFVDGSDSLLGGEINGSQLTQKTYAIEGMDLKLRAEEAGGGQFLSSTFSVTESSCDEITISLIGIPVKLKRK